MEDQVAERRHVSHDEIQTVTGRTFQASVLDARGPVVVEFMSYGCAHCGVMEPVLQRVAARLKGTETVVRVNVGVEQGLAERYGIAGTPTMVVFSNGREVRRVEGPIPTAENLFATLTQPSAT